MNGVLIIDKPAGMTSHDVVAGVRRILQERSVGHLGTLDPMATGVLPLVVGKMTRLAQFYVASEKAYEGTIRLGFATNTYDAEGEPIGEQRECLLGLDEIRELAKRFRGTIEQVPPSFSAKKVEGVPAYELARKHRDVKLKPVKVEVKEFEIVRLENSLAHFHARVSSGTYMRTIAHDLGQLAGCGGHLASLRRTVVAEFDIGDAHTLEEVETAAQCNDAEKLFVHPRQLLPAFPAVTATDEIAARIRNGRAVNLPELSRAREVKVFQGQRELIAISTRVAGTLFHARVVFS